MFLGGDSVYSCLTCEGYLELNESLDKSFEVCQHCRVGGLARPNDDEDGSHSLTGFILRGREDHLAPIRELLPSDSPIVRAIKTRNKVRS
jgi:hypothetical protein